MPSQNNGLPTPNFMNAQRNPAMFPQNGMQMPPNVQPSPAMRNQAIPQQDPSMQRQIPTPNSSLLAPQGPNFARMSPHLPPGTPQIPNMPQQPQQQRPNGGLPLQQSGQNMTGPAFAQVPGPIAEQKFEQLWQHVVANHKLQLQERWMQFDGRQINLYQLHKVVFGMGGYQFVRSSFPHLHILLCS